MIRSRKLVRRGPYSSGPESELVENDELPGAQDNNIASVVSVRSVSPGIPRRAYRRLGAIRTSGHSIHGDLGRDGLGLRPSSQYYRIGRYMVPRGRAIFVHFYTPNEKLLIPRNIGRIPRGRTKLGRSRVCQAVLNK